MMPTASPSDLAFGRFRVNPAQRTLWVDGKPAKLGGRAFDVLVALAERRDRVVGKNELLDLVWPNVVVEENNLQVQISALRKLFGSELIVTIPGRGYRFTATVEGASEPVPNTPAAPPSGAPRPSPTNLPAPQPLYGRESDIDAVRRLLGASRLVTIVGAGGIGKTRVALSAAHAQRENHSDGVWLIELAPLSDAALLPGSVAQALGLQLRGQRASHEELIAALASRRLLLVLDNCEHLIDAAALLARQLLAGAPGVHLLATSQEPLRLSNEQLLRLGTLGVPDQANAPIDPVAAIDYGAVRLFTERVRALDQRFALDAGNVAAVIDICRHLDGLALAIELAAARVPALGVTGVRERLGERLRLLTAGSRAAPHRQQALRAALDWSHGLLDAAEQAVFRRLAVFSGGCTIEAAQQVAADAQLDEWSVLDALARLVDKSLVVADGNDAGPRYRLLESARAYAYEKLAEKGEADMLARQHARFFASRFERWCDAFCAGTLSEDGFIASRSVELDNLRAALAWSLQPSGDVDCALELVAHSSPLSLLMPSYGECGRWWQALAQRLGGTPLEPRQAALYACARIHWGVQGLRLSAHESQVLAIDTAVLRALGDPRREAHALTALALHSIWRGDLAKARAILDDATARLDPGSWPSWLAAVHLSFSIRIDWAAGVTASHADSLAAMLARIEAVGEDCGRGAFTIRTHLGEDSLLQGRVAEAADLLGALADEGRRQRRDVYRMCFVLAPYALALTDLDRLDEARRVVLEMLPLLQHTGLRTDYAPILALLAAKRGRFEAAARLLGAGDAYLARAGGRRSLIERSAGERVLARLDSELPKAVLGSLLEQGAQLSEDAFTRLVVEES